MLKDILIDKNNISMIKELVSTILELKVNNVEYKDIISFKTISEYKFSMIKTTCSIEMLDNIEVYFKIIKKDRIKESLFCYWCLLFEEELRKINKEDNMNTIINNVIISEVGMERYKNSVFLEIKDNESGILENGTEVHFVDFVKYIEYNKSLKNNFEKWDKYLDKNNEDILMIGVVLNKDIGRSNIHIV